MENSWGAYAAFGNFYRLFKCIKNIFTLTPPPNDSLLPTLNLCGLHGTDSHPVAPSTHVNQVVLITANRIFWKCWKRRLSSESQVDFKCISGKDLSSSLFRSICLFHSGTSPFVPERNEASLIFVATKKNYIHKTLAWLLPATRLLRLLKSFFHIK